MPFFNFRRGDSSAATLQAAVPESADVLRRRARHRLIGSAVLVLAGVIGFPLVFDTQPRPVAVDLSIEMPGKTVVKPLVSPSATSPATGMPVEPPIVVPTAPTGGVAGEKVAAAASLTAEEEIVPSKSVPARVNKLPAATKPEAKLLLPPSVKTAPKVEVKTDARADAKTETKTDAKPSAADKAAHARALLNGTRAQPMVAASAAGEDSESSERFIVQVGAFADVVKAREVRLKVEDAGLKTYTQVAETTGGKRIRVRVGPFATRGAADKAASKIKTLGLSAAILTL